MMPQDLGNGHTIYGYFRRCVARASGSVSWRRYTTGSEGQGRLPEPSAGCVHSQSIKIARQGADVGSDGHKSQRPQRHILIDILRPIVAAVVTVANVAVVVTVANTEPPQGVFGSS